MIKTVYIGSTSDSVREDILVSLEKLNKKRITNRIEEADIIVLEDGWYKHPTLRRAFEYGLKNGIKIIHYNPVQTKEFLFAIAKDHLDHSNQLSVVSGRCQKREAVIYRSAACAFLLKCGLPPEIVGPFVNRDRSLMYHYAKLHKAEMITTPLYKTVYSQLIRKVL